MANSLLKENADLAIILVYKGELLWGAGSQPLDCFDLRYLDAPAITIRNLPTHMRKAHSVVSEGLE